MPWKSFPTTKQAGFAIFASEVIHSSDVMGFHVWETVFQHMRSK